MLDMKLISEKTTFSSDFHHRHFHRMLQRHVGDDICWFRKM